MDNLISVVIPVYNVEKYIYRCLSSVVNQTYKNLEIICVNDCTQDKSMDIVRDFAYQDKRIKIVEREKNGGLSAARNSGVEVATGEYIYYLDSDDWIDKDYLEIMLQKALQYKTDILLNTNIKTEYENSASEDYQWATYNKKLPQGEYLNREYAVNNTHCMVWCHLYKRKFLLKNNLYFPEGYVNEDNYYSYVAKINTDKIFAFYGPSYHYYQRKSSIMGQMQKEQHDLSYLKIVKLICEYNKKYEEFNKYKIKIVNANIFYVINSQEMFEISKYICEYIQDNLRVAKSFYNESELFIIKKISEAKNLAELKRKFPKGLKMAFLINHIRTKHLRPKVSIIIPVHNSERYLKRTLNSVLIQTFKDFQVICINDYSTDKSLEILNDFAKKDDRIKIINNEKNIGAALSRNLGIDKANGKYIYFLDSDDYIDEKYIECMVEKIEQENCDIILNLSIINELNGLQNRYTHPSMPKIIPAGQYLDKITIIHDAPCFIWARMYKKEFLNKYNLRFTNTHADDVVFNTITSVYCDKTYAFFGESYHYTVDSTGMTAQAQNSNTKDLNHIKAYSLIYDFLNERNKLDKNLKLFRVYPFMKVDSEEKFEFYRKFLKKIEENFRINENIYNDMEKFFAQSILNTSTYDEYLKNYNKVITIGYLRRKKMNDLISVIIPVKNGSKYIHQAIEGIHRQGMNIEIIVVDDCSTDNTVQIAQNFGCTIVKHQTPKGAVAGKNSGIKIAKGEYILFHDHDDIMNTGTLRELYDNFKPDIMAIEAKVQDFYSSDLSEEERSKTLIKKTPYYGLFTGAILIRKKVFDKIGLFNETLLAGEILEWQSKMDLYNFKIQKVDFVSTMRRIHSANFGRTHQKTEFKDYAAILREKIRNK